jgi:quinol monooxygenase YgiN
MTLRRRTFLSSIAAALGMLGLPSSLRGQGTSMNRFGLHGKLMAHPGQRDALSKILLDAARVVSPLPGCEIYFVSTDEQDANALYVTEVWKSEADHKASLEMPEVRALIEKGRPMVAGFGDSTRLVPLGGHGLG